MQQSPPFLAPPGAGIPLLQRLALRYLFKPLKLRGGAGVEQLIVALSEGRTDLPPADTAAVKPELERNHSAAIDEYLNFSRDFHTRLRSAVANTESAATHPHPWFGAMNLRQWYWLMSTHTQIHRKQIREICKQP